MFQKNLNIKLYNYIIVSGKYITNLNDGKRKEYDLKIKQLIYEGECLNGFKNGKVKEYGDCKLIFEGEYLKEKRNGKGKE